MLEKELLRMPTNFQKLEDIKSKIQPIRQMWMETTEWRKRYPMIVEKVPFSDINYLDVCNFLKRWDN